MSKWKRDEVLKYFKVTATTSELLITPITPVTVFTAALIWFMVVLHLNSVVLLPAFVMLQRNCSFSHVQKFFKTFLTKALYLPKYKNVFSVFLWGCPNIFKLTLELHYSGRHCSTALFTGLFGTLYYVTLSAR